MNKEITLIYFEALKIIPLKDIDNHYSDLYLRVTKESKELISRYKYKNLVETFKDNIDNDLWYDIPFAFPYKIFEGNNQWYFKEYDENGNHIYDNNIPRIGYFEQFYKSITVSNFEKYKIIF